MIRCQRDFLCYQWTDEKWSIASKVCRVWGLTEGKHTMQQTK